MNSVHDMGGMHGFGPIPYEEDEPVFHHPWEGRVYAMRTRTPVQVPGGGRYALERMDQALYLASSYYERWLHAGIQGLIEAGAFTQAEFDEALAFYRANPLATPPRREDPEAVERALLGAYAAASRRRAVAVRPAFAIGDAVQARNIHPAGHTRLPRYARGKRAVVVKYYGVQDFDDAVSAGLGAQPQPLYSVRFEGAELWGESAEPNSAVYLDMWESYLESV
jgi:nitrile hydratase beta subunit